MFITYNKAKPVNNHTFNYKLNLENQKELCNFIEVIKTKNTIFDLVYFIAAHTPHYEEKPSNSTFSGNFSQKIFNKFLKINCFAPIFIF